MTTVQKKSNRGEFYPFRQIEEKYRSSINNPVSFEDLKPGELQYIVPMFPYPSGKAHAGHLRAFTVSDTITRFLKLIGKKVFQPMGFDSFGLPAEEASRKNGMNPQIWTEKNIKTITDDFHRANFCFNWVGLETHQPAYYRIQQKIIIKFWEMGLLERKKSWVNWDPVLKTVLANEQVKDGICWRSGAKVEKRLITQWFLKISKFAGDLFDKTDDLSWPSKIKKMQKNWIGRSRGAIIYFEKDGRKIPVFTTRPETVFGVTFLALSPESSLALKYYQEQSKAYLNGKRTNEPIDELFHPETGKKIPLFLGDYVLSDYGTGMVMGVPSEDERDKVFAEDMKLKSIEIIKNNLLVNSSYLNGMTVGEARSYCFKKFGKKENFRLRDWCISRQRYWGAPMPFIYCDDCGIIPDHSLPVLPNDVDFSVEGNPLDHHSWSRVNCPKCKRNARRDTDTMDTFVDSSWYFYRFTALAMKNDGKINLVNTDLRQLLKPIPITKYTGGAEHATMHLIYARAMNLMLQKAGIVEKPFVEDMFCFGMVLGPTYQGITSKKYYNPMEIFKKDGKFFAKNEEVAVGPVVKMSKSLNNGFAMGDLIDKHGSDAARLYILSDSPVERDFEWCSDGILTATRFLNRLWHFSRDVANGVLRNFAETTDPKTIMQLEKLFQGTTHNLSAKVPKFNVYISNLRKISNILTEEGQLQKITKEDHKKYFINLLTNLSPVIPSVCFACLEMLGEDFRKISWYGGGYKTDKPKLVIQINGITKTVQETKHSNKKQLIQQAKSYYGGEIKRSICIINPRSYVVNLLTK
jgi:leucyl-tRNA synthetase